MPGSMIRSVILAAAALLAASPAAAKPALKFSGGVTLVSQYRFRGIGLSDQKPALQGTLNLSHDSGLYAGAWGSGLEGFGELGGSKLELDLYAGYKHELLPGATLDVGLLYYAYPGSTGGNFEFFEPYANVSGAVGPGTAKLGIAFAPSDKAIGGNSNLYSFADYALPINGTPIAINSHIGYSKGRTTLTPGGNYFDWSLGASATWRNFTAGVSYVDTSISRRDAHAAGATPGIVDSAVVFSLGASF